MNIHRVARVPDVQILARICTGSIPLFSSEGGPRLQQTALRVNVTMFYARRIIGAALL